MASFPLKIVTPDGVAFDGEVKSLSCRTVCGQVELLGTPYRLLHGVLAWEKPISPPRMALCAGLPVWVVCSVW